MKAEINALHKMHNFHINNTKFITIGIIKRFLYRNIKILTGLFFYDIIDNILSMMTVNLFSHYEVWIGQQKCNAYTRHF